MADTQIMITHADIEQFFADIRAMVRNSIPAEMRDAIDASRQVHPCAGMTDAERADWIMGVSSE